MNIIFTQNCKSSILRFKLSVHKLGIETGRHNEIDRHLRNCQNCSLNKMEDEYHFLLECPKYCNLRNQFLKPYYNRRPTAFKFIQIMLSKNSEEINKLSKYIFAFKEPIP